MNLYRQLKLVQFIFAHNLAHLPNLKENYIDYCDYIDDKYYQCGDICLSTYSRDNKTVQEYCTCGDEDLYLTYCCISPTDSCMENERGAECPNGKVLDKYSPEPITSQVNILAPILTSVVRTNVLNGKICVKE